VVPEKNEPADWRVWFGCKGYMGSTMWGTGNSSFLFMYIPFFSLFWRDFGGTLGAHWEGLFFFPCLRCGNGEAFDTNKTSGRNRLINVYVIIKGVMITLFNHCITRLSPVMLVTNIVCLQIQIEYFR